MKTGNTLAEAMLEADKEMIAQCTRNIRAAGISETEEARILSRGHNYKFSHTNQDKNAVQISPMAISILIAIVGMLSFLAGVMLDKEIGIF